MARKRGHMMSSCQNCYFYGVCKIREIYGEPKHDCAMFQDVKSILPMLVPLGSHLWVIEDGKVWKGILEKVSISKTNGVWLEVTMPPEMPDVASIEYCPDDFGKTFFRSEDAALNALDTIKKVRI